MSIQRPGRLICWPGLVAVCVFLLDMEADAW